MQLQANCLSSIHLPCSGIVCHWQNQSGGTAADLIQLQAATHPISVCLFVHTALLQLYINYKLKSVAALPWRQMTFKFLNTIIDDLFAFVIKMPLLHRLSVFRDDVIFLIYLYQRWIYRVDKRRANEFG